MSLKIRLTRSGAKKRPFYRIVVADARAPRDGRFIEKLGVYNPLLPKDHEQRVHLKEDRIQHWLSHGAKPTDRVTRFLDAAGIMKRTPRNNPEKGKPHARALERLAAKTEETPTENAPSGASSDASPKEATPPEDPAPQEEAATE